MTIEFGFNFPQGQTWETIATWVRTAERVGIDHVWSEDHLVGIPPTERLYESWTVISMIAGATRTLRFGHQVLCQSFRNPALLAKMAATLDYLSGGRFIFGLGAGWFPIEYQQYNYPFPSIGQRLQEFRETIEICKRMWTQEEATYRGKHYAIEEAMCYPKPAQRPHPPIFIGGAGEKVMLRIVAEHADIWNNFQTYIHELEAKLDVLKRHCDAVGRNFGDITVAQQVSLILGRDEADAKAKLAKAKQGMYLDDPETTAIWGHPQKVIDEIGHHHRRGVTLFNFGGPVRSTPEGLEHFAAEVLPAFR